MKKLPTESKESKERLIAKLREVECNWDHNYMLFAWSGTLCLMLKTEHAKLMSDPNYKPLLVSFSRIPCDGGGGT